METTNVNIRTEKGVKDAAEEVFNELGLNMTTAVNIFLRQVIREKGMPFPLKLSVPNDVTMSAIAEGRKLASSTDAKGYHSMDDLRTALEA